MIQRQKLSRGIKSRSVSTDSSGISFLTPIDGGTLPRLNSGASYATGGMFRDLRNISSNSPDRLEKSTWPLGIRSSDTLGNNTVVKSLVEETVSLKTKILKLEMANSSYQDQLSCVPEIVQCPLQCDSSCQTDFHETLLIDLADKSIMIEMLNHRAQDLESCYRDSLRQNELLEEKIIFLQLQHEEIIRSLKEEKIQNEIRISSLESAIEEQRLLNLLAQPAAQHQLSIPSQSMYLDPKECTLLFKKFKTDHKSDKRNITNTFNLFNEYLCSLKIEFDEKIKLELQNVIVKYEKQIITKDNELINISSDLIISNELLTKAAEGKEKQTKDLESLSLCLKTAADYLVEISSKHNSVIQSILHDAHIKDLARISALRESALERDKVTNDLEFCRDVINVISFSLKTAEQSLLEDHPDLHTKLVSGRVKSLKNLQVSATEKQKNIDFRSIEMCSLSSSHLEEFQTKAQQGVSTATEEFLSLMETFRNHLCYVVSD